MLRTNLNSVRHKILGVLLFPKYFPSIISIEVIKFLILVDELSHYTDDDDDYSDSEESRLLAIKCEIRMYQIDYDSIKFFFGTAKLIVHFLFQIKFLSKSC